MIFGIVISFLFLFDGLRKISQFIILSFQWKQSQDWQSSQGKIIQSNLQSVLVPSGGRRSRNLDGSVRLITAYIPNILYEYRANAESFQSGLIFLGQSFPTDHITASNFVEQYPVDKRVVVYFNPEKPDCSVLERSWHKELFGYLIGGILYLLFGFGILIQVIRE
ncbi:MAG: DUF3592 domain-containing protein [Anaerolineae bacterium]|nr:DUF3592 domain-containing protein [Anaerolineae bacterium]